MVLRTKALIPLVLAVFSILPLITPVAAYYYEMEILPGNAVSPGTEVTLIAKSNDTSVTRVLFEWKNPDGTTERETDKLGLIAPFEVSDSYVVEKLGEWEVSATFFTLTSSSKRIAKITVFLTVIPEVPLGTMMAMIASFAALATLATRRHL